MKILELEYSKNIERTEFKKLISFVSNNIIKFEVLDSTIKLFLEDNCDEEKIISNYKILTEKYCNTKDKEQVVYKNEIEEDINFMTYNKIYESGMVKKYGDGLIGFNHDLVLLFNFFHSVFRKFATEEKAEERIYPTLLSVEEYKKTGYMKSSPQYSTFCCDVIEDIDSINQLNECVNHCETKKILSEPRYALSPAACFHTYMEFQNQDLDENKSITFVQKVFRNEGRFNWDEFGRLRDYNVREIVFIGDEEFVSIQRQKIIDKTIKLIKELNLAGEIVSSSDPFITPDMQKYKRLQIHEKNKYEARVYTSKDKSIACASFNLHGVSFTKPFNIKIGKLSKTVTGCIGFGIERWVLAFISQYGLEKKEWPQIVIDFEENYN